MRLHQSRKTGRHPVRVLVVLFALVAAALPWAGSAQAHGTIVNPATRADRKSVV